MPPLVLALLEAVFSPFMDWIFGKTSDKAKQEEYKKELNKEVDQKNAEVKAMSAPDRDDRDVLAGLRDRQLPNSKG